MSNTVITLLVVFAFAAGLGLGLVTILRPRQPKPRAGQKTESTVYFGRDDNDDPDHPRDIERQGTLAPQRAVEHRYDGMADGDAPYNSLAYGQRIEAMLVRAGFDVHIVEETAPEGSTIQ